MVIIFLVWSNFGFEHQLVNFAVLLSGKNRQTRKNSQGKCTGRGVRCEKGQKWMLLSVTSALTESPWFSLPELHLIWKQPYSGGLYCAFSSNTLSVLEWHKVVFVGFPPPCPVSPRSQPWLGVPVLLHCCPCELYPHYITWILKERRFLSCD